MPKFDRRATNLRQSRAQRRIVTSVGWRSKTKVNSFVSWAERKNENDDFLNSRTSSKRHTLILLTLLPVFDSMRCLYKFSYKKIIIKQLNIFTKLLLLFFRYLHKPLVLSRRARATSRWYDAASKANSRLIAELVVDELQRLIGTIEIKNNSIF